MIQPNALELALRGPSRLTADLAGRTRDRAHQPNPAPASASGAAQPS